MKKVVFLILISLFLIWNCGQDSKEAAASKEIKKEKPSVTVSILPQEYFVQRIVGDKYKINVMIPPGHSPATYEPTPREMRAVSESILYFRIGFIAFEKAWMDKIASINKGMKIVDTSRGVTFIRGTPYPSHEASETKSLHHLDNRGIDPHIWLSPSAVKVQVKNILEAFMETDPDTRVIYEENYQAFIQDIEQLQAENKAVLEPFRGRQFMVYHPAWSYFAREYGLIQFPIEIEGKSPSAANLKKIIDLAKKENIHVIFVQQQFDANSARAAAREIDGKVITMDPLSPDWLNNMKKMALTFKEALTH
jgi:zinc transport system substrate-binding protein